MRVRMRVRVGQYEYEFDRVLTQCNGTRTRYLLLVVNNQVVISLMLPAIGLGAVRVAGELPRA